MSFWIGDPDELDRIAAGLDADAEQVRQTALGLVLRSEQAHWVSASAQRYREVVAGDRRRAEGAADGLERSAHLLRAHAERVRERLAWLEKAGPDGVTWLTHHLAELAAGGE